MLVAIFRRIGVGLGAMAMAAWGMFTGAFDAFDHANAAKNAMIAAGAPEWLFPPWWGPVACSFALTGFLIWLNWPSPTAINAVPQSELSAAGTAVVSNSASGEAIPVQPRYLSEAMVAGSNMGSAPEFRARFARSGRDVRFYVEFSAYFGGFGGGWSQPTQVLTRDVARFAKGEVIRFAIVRSMETKEGLRWQFGDNTTKDGMPTFVIDNNISYRGRVLMLSPDDTIESCYFITAFESDMSAPPQVIGENMWAHEHEWEGRKPPNGEAESLFD